MSDFKPERLSKKPSRRIGQGPDQNYGKLEEQLKEYLAEIDKYKNIADSTWSWEYVQSTAGAILYCTPSAERITGYSAKEFLDNPDLILRIIHPYDLSKFLTHHLHVMQKHERGNVTVRIITKTGELRYIDHNCTPHTDSKGHYIGCRASNNEINIRNLPQDALSDKENRFRSFFRLMDHGVIFFDKNGIIEEVSPSASRILGVSRESMIGKSLYEHSWRFVDQKGNDLSPEDLPVSIALKTASKTNGILGISIPDHDNITWLNLFVTPVIDDESTMLSGVFVTIEDVTSELKLKSAQEAVNKEVLSYSQGLELKIHDRIIEIVQLSNLNQAIVNSLGLSLITTTVDGFITGFNREAEILLGYKAEEIIDKYSILSFHKHEELVNMARQINDDLGQEVLPDFNLFVTLCEHFTGKLQEWTYIRKDGSEVPVILSVNYLRDPEGKLAGYLGVAFDNSTRKTTEELLRWNEHLLRLMSDSSPFGFLFTDKLSGKILYTNHRFCEIWNFTGIEGKMKNGSMNYKDLTSSMISLLKDSEPYTVLLPDKGNYSDNEFIRGEVQLRDGRTIGVFLTQISSIKDDYDGHFYIFEDITERKLTEKKLQLQNAAFESVALAVLITDLAGFIIWVNPAFSKLTGYTVEEAIGMHTRSLKSGKTPDEVYKGLWETILAGNVWSGELINRRKDGSFYNEVETITPIYNDKGQINRFISVKIDITHRLEMENALRISEARWQTALEGSGYGIWDYNVLTREVFYSANYKTMLGYDARANWTSLEEWSGRVHPRDIDKCREIIHSHYMGETDIYIHEYRMRCKDGSYKWIHDSGKVIEWIDKGHPSRVIGTHLDIDARKRLETSLQESIEKERELNEMKSRFVSTASHEFRTPLSSILITSDSLLTYWERMENNQIKDKLTKINNQVLHLTKIVNDVLQLSKIEEGKVEFNPAEIDIIEICRQVIDSFNSDPRLQSKVYLVTPFNTVMMKLDTRLIFQVINNLVSNGIKYSPDNPNVRVEIARKNHELCITVSDTGIGIPDADQKHLFKPFYRGSNTTIIQGNGLGLSIVKESVILHGGKISFKSRLGHGTTFYITFPDELIKSYN